MLKFLFVFLILFLVSKVESQTLQAVNLKCEYKTNPLGIEAETPALSWQIVSPLRAVTQSAYNILVADDSMLLKKNIGNLWESKKVTSSQSIQVFYHGKKLNATKTYYWKVRVWDNKQNTSTWSKISQWQMGLQTKADWKGARWIAYDKIADSNINILPIDGAKDKYQGNNVLPLLRKTFTIKKPIKQATMFVTGLGHFDVSLNSKKVSDHFLDAGWTKYDQQALYVPFDLTKEIKTGNNVVGVMLGNGFYYIPPVPGRYRKTKTAFGHPKLICRLAITYTDGSSEDIISDTSWRTSPSPITFSSIYGGEDYNAILEQGGWDQPNFNDDTWKQVITVDGPPVLNAQMAEPLKVMQTFDPVKVNKISSNTYVYDLGQNASGIPQIRVQGQRGDTVKIYPAELLKDDGTINQKPTGSPYFLQYILKGNGVETWQPRFTYYGYRYLQISGAVPKQDADKDQTSLIEVKGLHVRNAAQSAGSFTNSNELFNKTNNLIDWAMKSNMVGLLTDCPHREKLGWLEEAHLMGNSLQYNYDIIQFGRKQIDDMMYSQLASGLVPEIAPEYVHFIWGGDMFRDSPEWGSNSIIMPWYLYQWYGDKSLLAKSYPMMQRYIEYLKTKAQGHILSQGLGDWYDLGPNAPGVSQLTPMGVTGTAIYYYDLGIMSKIANLLNKPDEATIYDQLAKQVKQAFNDTFFNKETKQYATGSQTANAMAVYMQLVDPIYKDPVVENIIKDIRNRNNSLTAGDIGYRYLLRVLHQAGRSDVIFDMNSNSDVPGYGYQLAKGATALTESWQALPTVSNNHFMLGHLMEWFYRGLAGINQSDTSIGFKDIVIQPEIVGDVTMAKGVYKSVYGTIVSEWNKMANQFQMHVSIPANTVATINLPAMLQSKILENNINIRFAKGVSSITYQEDRAIIKIGSGNYHFTVLNPK